MKNIEPKPYKLINKIQHYDWGTKNADALIPHLLNIEPQKNLPYAELWIGIHKNAPSEVEINNERFILSEMIANNPIKILGERVAEKYENQLPFLLKVLSIDRALSIQSHPNKDLAEILHKKDPTNYPDDNHKPEIAIAIDELKAIVGLKSYTEIKELLIKYDEIKKILGEDKLAEFINTNKKSKNVAIKNLYSEIMNLDDEKLKNCILSFVERFKKEKNQTEAEEQFLIQFDNYGLDIGLISLLLFNLVTLQKDNALFTAAGIPHAYIKGNIIECMANSDNVVRAGLTNKYKDIKTLSDMLEVDSSKSAVEIIAEKNITYYKTPAEEFELHSITLDKQNSQIQFQNSEVTILLVLEGDISIKWISNSIENSLDYKSGEAILIPAILNKYDIVSNKKSKIFRVIIP